MDLVARLKAADKRNAKALERNGNPSKIKYLTIKDGETAIVRMLPMGNTDELSYPFKEYKAHQLDIKDGFRTFVCTNDPEELVEINECPLCLLKNEFYEAANELEEQEGEKTPEFTSILKVAKDLYSRDRVSVNVLVKGANTNEGEFMVLDMSRATFNAVLALIKDPDYGIITDIENGCDLSIMRTGIKLDTIYTVNPKRVNAINIPADWHKHVVNLKALRHADIKSLSYIADTMSNGESLKTIELKNIPYTKQESATLVDTKSTSAAKKSNSTSPTPSDSSKVTADVGTSKKVVKEETPEVVQEEVKTPEGINAPEAPKEATEVSAKISSVLEKLRASKK